MHIGAGQNRAHGRAKFGGKIECAADLLTSSLRVFGETPSKECVASRGSPPKWCEIIAQVASAENTMYLIHCIYGGNFAQCTHAAFHVL